MSQELAKSYETAKALIANLQVESTGRNRVMSSEDREKRVIQITDMLLGSRENLDQDKIRIVVRKHREPHRQDNYFVYPFNLE